MLFQSAISPYCCDSDSLGIQDQQTSEVTKRTATRVPKVFISTSRLDIFDILSIKYPSQPQGWISSIFCTESIHLILKVGYLRYSVHKVSIPSSRLDILDIRSIKYRFRAQGWISKKSTGKSIVKWSCSLIGYRAVPKKVLVQNRKSEVIKCKIKDIHNT
ncbi:hypothetical protein RRG08_064122 [Elysia crispata]|uniref:Uncharacterized protein n=1 Tax=Elysia crispata TaxID=231223 RepID=A0AAE1DYL9_9GAST|nr:hypothetical protein RRG08_064122 [Elysia crispata]